MDERLGTAVLELTTDDARLNRGLADGEQNVRAWVGRVGGDLRSAALPLLAPAAAGIGVITAAGAALAPAIGMAREFESSIADLGLAASSTGLSMDTLKAAAIAVGGDTDLLGVSASGAAEAMTGLYKAGLSSTEIMGDMQGYLAGTAELGGALRAAIDLAAASELDMVQASDLAAVALATFGGELETEEERAQFINDAMNNMVQAADASVASVSDLAAALSTAGPVFAMYGYSLEDTNNALAILSTRGIAGAEAGTALKSMLVNMTSDVPAVTETWGALGLSIYDADGAMRDLPDVIGDLNLAMADMTEEQRNATIQTLAGSYGMKALATLLAEGEEGWDAMAEATANAATIQEQAATKAATLAGAQESLEGVLETIMIQVGDSFIPVLTTLAETFGELADEYGPQLVAVMATLGAWLGENLPGFVEGAVAAFTGLLETLAPIVTWIQEFATEHAEILQEALIAIGAIIAAAGIALAIGAIASAVATLANPLTLVIAAVGLLATAWARDWGGIQTKLTEVWAIIEPTLTIVRDWLEVHIPVAIEWMRDAIDTALAFVQGLWTSHNEEVTGTVSGLWETVTTAFQTAIAWLEETIEVFLALVQGWWEDHGESVTTAVTTFWSAIQTAFDTSIAWIEETVEWFLDLVKGWWEDHGESVTTVVTALWSAIQVAFQTAIDVISGIFQAYIDALTFAWETFGPWLTESVGTVWETIKTTFENFTAIVGGIFDLFAAALTGDWEGAEEALVTIAETLWSQFEAVFTAGKDIVIGLVTAAVEGFKALWAGIDAGQIGADLVNPIIRAINGIIGAWNALELSIPSITIPNPLPGDNDWTVGGGSVGFPDLPLIPELDAGGIVTRPTLAWIGERRPEAVIPLEDARAGNLLGGRQYTFQITNHEPERTTRLGLGDLITALEMAHA